MFPIANVVTTSDALVTTSDAPVTSRKENWKPVVRCVLFEKVHDEAVGAATHALNQVLSQTNMKSAVAVVACLAVSIAELIFVLVQEAIRALKRRSNVVCFVFPV